LGKTRRERRIVCTIAKRSGGRKIAQHRSNKGRKIAIHCREKGRTIANTIGGREKGQFVAVTIEFRERGHKIAKAIRVARIRNGGERRIAAKFGRGTVRLNSNTLSIWGWLLLAWPCKLIRLLTATRFS
jgi:hypothetical protein